MSEEFQNKRFSEHPLHLPIYKTSDAITILSDNILLWRDQWRVNGTQYKATFICSFVKRKDEIDENIVNATDIFIMGGHHYSLDQNELEEILTYTTFL